MTIENITCKVKTERLSSTRQERVINLKLVVTVRNGKNLIDVELTQDINEIEKEAIKKAKEKLLLYKK